MTHSRGWDGKQEQDEENNDKQSQRKWQDVTEEDYNKLYRHLHAEYKDFKERHHLGQYKKDKLRAE
jgi:HSP90 family molecular chaperone